MRKCSLLNLWSHPCNDEAIGMSPVERSEYQVQQKKKRRESWAGESDLTAVRARQWPLVHLLAIFLLQYIYDSFLSFLLCCPSLVLLQQSQRREKREEREVKKLRLRMKTIIKQRITTLCLLSVLLYWVQSRWRQRWLGVFLEHIKGIADDELSSGHFQAHSTDGTDSSSHCGGPRKNWVQKARWTQSCTFGSTSL